MNSSRRAPALKVLGLGILAVIVVGCGGSDVKTASADNGSAGSTVSRDAASAELAPTSAVGDGLSYDTSKNLGGEVEAGGDTPAASPDALERAVIRTGSLRVESKDPAEARRDALQLVTGLGGSVADEQSVSNDKGKLRRVDLTLRIPTKSFDKALDQLGELGVVVDRQQSAEDVTTQVIDIEARIKAQAASVDSIRNLLARATSIRDIVSIESQLTRRQAELDSLTQQQRYLKDQTSLSTIAVTLVQPDKKVKKDEPRDGFIGGLESGWDALGDSAESLGKGIGAALPFAAVLVLLVGGFRVLRRRS